MQTDKQTTSNADHENRSFAALRISGADSVEFLQGQLTQDIALLTPERPLLAGWNSPKGRLLCVLWLVEWQESIWLLLPAALCAQVEQRLRMFVLRSKVTIEVSDTPVHITISPEDNDFMHCFYNDLSISIATSPGTLLTLGKGPADEDSSNWRVRQIAAGIPTVWPETREEFVPQMLNLDLLGAISFTKGCYVGQEIVARTQNLGRIKRRMYAFRLPGLHNIAPGTALEAAGRAVGKVVDAGQDGTDTLILAVIRIENLGDELTIAGIPHVRLKRGDLPYAVPESI